MDETQAMRAPNLVRALPVWALTVCVTTYRRNDALACLLPALLNQAAQFEPGVARVLVVDNDAAGGAQGTSAAFPGVEYRHEATPGISAARNRALDEAAGGTYLVFIDDDEIPDVGWLESLWRTAESSGADGVLGPVRFDFEAAPSAWVTASPVFDVLNFPTGTHLGEANTGNLLLRMSTVERNGLRFPLSFGLTGGEDTVFTRSLVRAGGAIVFCREAVTRELTPASRTRPAWVLRRAYRAGVGELSVRFHFRSTPIERLMTGVWGIWQGLGRAVTGIGRIATGIALRDVTRRSTGAYDALVGAGMITGAAGLKYREYHRR